MRPICELCNQICGLTWFYSKYPLQHYAIKVQNANSDIISDNSFSNPQNGQLNYICICIACQIKILKNKQQQLKNTEKIEENCNNDNNIHINSNKNNSNKQHQGFLVQRAGVVYSYEPNDFLRIDLFQSISMTAQKKFGKTSLP
eukprot:TRINITY_DN7763_c0_g1_i1.p1 TRINITY_DN7763_c0_g1~~TRINITY_DN7763_c0_g1_i1.p1  ORF type:complete len:144 (+),score=14.88 TRINITY_DN7763_c0_g1_i1:131-562(+)